MNWRTNLRRNVKLVVAIGGYAILLGSGACTCLNVTLVVDPGTGSSAGYAHLAVRTMVPTVPNATAYFEGTTLRLPGEFSLWVDTNNSRLNFFVPPGQAKPWATFPDDGINRHAVVSFTGREILKFESDPLVPGHNLLVVYRSARAGTLLSSSAGMSLELAPDSLPDGLSFTPGRLYWEPIPAIEISSRYPLNDGRPHIVGVLHQQDEDSVFLDGKHAGKQRHEVVSPAATTWTLGAAENGENGFRGDVGGVWFLKANLSVGEMLATMCALIVAYDIPELESSNCTH